MVPWESQELWSYPEVKGQKGSRVLIPRDREATGRLCQAQADKLRLKDSFPGQS